MEVTVQAVEIIVKFAVINPLANNAILHTTFLRIIVVILPVKSKMDITLIT